MEMPETRESPRWLGEDVNHKLGRWRNAHLGEYGMKGGSTWRGSGVVKRVFGFCEVTIGTVVNEPLHSRKDRHERILENVESNPQTTRRMSARQQW